MRRLLALLALPALVACGGQPARHLAQDPAADEGGSSAAGPAGDGGVDGESLALAAGGATAAYLLAGKRLLPDKTVQWGPSTSIALEKLVSWGAWAAAAYLVLDPWAPNWEIEEAAFPERHFHLALRMKRLYNGGAGEAQQVFRHRAQEIMRRSGYTQYEVVEYSESLDSSLLGSQRTARGGIRLRREG